MTISARECVNVDTFGLDSTVGLGRGRLPAVESRDSLHFADAVAIEVGR